MNPLRIALAQINPVVGALAANAQKIERVAGEAASAGAQVVVFPELAVSGYPPEDLVLKRHFVTDCQAAVDALAARLPAGLCVIVGTPWPGPERAANAAVVLREGRVAQVYRKMLLPNYGVFDELRVFAAGAEPGWIDVDRVRIGLHVCEDSWYPAAAPCTALRAAGAQVVVNLSASPYHRGKLGLRQEVLGAAARAVGAPLLYCNVVGGQDELVFDGASLALDAAGRLVARARAFAEDLLVVDVPTSGTVAARIDANGATPTAPVGELPPEGGTTNEPQPVCSTGFSRSCVGSSATRLGPAAGGTRIEPTPAGPAEVYAALELGLRDYVDKNGFRKVVVAVSGGIDSALVAALAVDALGRDRVVTVTMPSQYSSHETLGDAHELARRLGVELIEVPIRRLHDEYLRDLAKLWPDRGPDTTEENLQARIRGNIVMALSNKFGWLVLTTGNKSELATGYCTLYGDMAGGFALIKDVPKTLVWELSRWRNLQTTLGAGPAPIPESTIDRPPSAELRPDQKDTDSLPPYDVLDPILERYVERDQGLAEMVAAGLDPVLVRRVIQLVDRNEYKRRQGAPGVKITPKAFGRDRRLPITHLYREPDRPGKDQP